MYSKFVSARSFAQTHIQFLGAKCHVRIHRNKKSMKSHQVTWLVRTCSASSCRALWRLSWNEKSQQPWLGYKIRPLLSSNSKSAASASSCQAKGQGLGFWKNWGHLQKFQYYFQRTRSSFEGTSIRRLVQFIHYVDAIGYNFMQWHAMTAADVISYRPEAQNLESFPPLSGLGQGFQKLLSHNIFVSPYTFFQFSAALVQHGYFSTSKNDCWKVVSKDLVLLWEFHV